MPVSAAAAVSGLLEMAVGSLTTQDSTKIDPKLLSDVLRASTMFDNAVKLALEAEDMQRLGGNKSNGHRTHLMFYKLTPKEDPGGGEEVGK